MMLQGGALEAQGRLAAAAALYETTAQSFPECAEPIEAYANALARMGQSERALAQFQCALQRRPDSANAHFRIGEILAQLGRYRESVPHFERAVALKPDWLEARELSGRMLWICHEYGAAAKVWREWRAAQAEAARSQGLDPQQFRILDPVWTRWLGNHAHLDAYVKIGLLGWRKPVPIKLLAPRGKVANEAYLALWRDYVEVVSAPEEIERLSALTGVLGDSLHTMLVDEVPTYYTNAIAVVQAEWERQGRAPLLQLSEEERERGWQMLASLGIPRTAWFACLHVREPGFWNEADDRTNRPRVASIRSYLPAIEHIVSRGGWVVRLGDSSMQALAPMPGLIDYARSDAKSDWMDVFLCASCRFLIGTNSALYQVCITFGTPSVATNWVPLSSFPMSGRDIVLPKRLRSRADGTELPFDAVLRLPRDAPFGQLFDHHRLDLIDNTPEEILEGVEEMLQRSDGVWESSDEARARVERFSEIAALHRVTVNGSIGERFLARHAGLLA
ncbi:MAG TPA: TIGR04372 family glycosyltransferase [Burkholderiales bacterium]|nr:TIGR04372 family glycosyltransferase [Burkholderiales bacterium]